MIFAHAPVTREHLHTLPVPSELPTKRRRDGGGTVWEPIPHGDLADTVVESLRDRGFGIVNETWQPCKKDLALIGGVELEITDEVELEYGIERIPDTNLTFGVRHSNNGLWALSCLVGANILICSNGMMVGDFVMTKKHTKYNDHEKVVNAAIDRFIEQSVDVQVTQSRLEGYDVGKTEGDHLVCEIGRREILPWKYIPKVLDEFANPRYDEFKGSSAWNLYMAVTEIVKERPAEYQVTTLNEARRLLIEHCWDERDVDETMHRSAHLLN